MVLFTLLTSYMIFAAVFCLIQAAKLMSTDSAFGQIILSLVVTYGCYIASAILALDPFHLVTCFVQYILMQAIYINVLQTYAFANLNNLTWGTKQLTETATDLGIVKSVGQDSVEVILPTAQADIGWSTPKY